MQKTIKTKQQDNTDEKWVKHLNRVLTKEDIEMANKHMK